MVYNLQVCFQITNISGRDQYFTLDITHCESIQFYTQCSFLCYNVSIASIFTVLKGRTHFIDIQ